MVNNTDAGTAASSQGRGKGPRSLSGALPGMAEREVQEGRSHNGFFLIKVSRNNCPEEAWVVIENETEKEKSQDAVTKQFTPLL